MPREAETRRGTGIGKMGSSSLLRLALLSFIFLATSPTRGEVVVNDDMTIDRVVHVNLIQVVSEDGQQKATTFGSASQRAYIEKQIDRVWAQAGIDVRFRSGYTSYLDDFALNGSPKIYTVNRSRPSSDFDRIASEGDAARAGSSDPTVIDAYFVDVVPDWPITSNSFTNGWAKQGIGGVAIYVGKSLLSSTFGRDIVAKIFAHEIGHNLGLKHTSVPNNLMNGDVREGRLRRQQIELVRAYAGGLLKAGTKEDPDPIDPDPDPDPDPTDRPSGPPSVDISYDRAANQMTLRFASSAGQFFEIYRTTDFGDPSATEFLARRPAWVVGNQTKFIVAPQTIAKGVGYFWVERK